MGPGSASVVSGSFPCVCVGVAFQAPPGSQASSRGEAKDSEAPWILSLTLTYR